MSPRRLLPGLIAVVLGVACAALVACGSGGSDDLIPSSNANTIAQQLSALEASVDQGNCGATGDDLGTLSRAVDNLPSSVDADLRKRLHAGVANLQVRAPKACAAQDTQEVTTPVITTDTTPTGTTTTTPPPTTTETTPPETTPTEPPATTPVEPPTTPGPPPATTPGGDPNDTGGASAP